ETRSNPRRRTTRLSHSRHRRYAGRNRNGLRNGPAPVILIDSNIPMYLVGAPHPHKADAQRLLEKLVSERQRLVTDAEVLQEILHLYVAIARRGAIQPAFDALLGIVDDVLSVERATAVRAKEIVLGHPRLSARDAVHLA